MNRSSSSTPRPRASPGLRAGDLHVGGEHRVGRGEHGAEQQRRGRRRGRPPSPAGRRAAMLSGIATASSRQVRRPAAPRRAAAAGSSGRSRARPTPISATSTASSVTCSMVARFSCGSSGMPSGSGVSPISHADGDEHHRRRDRPAVQELRAGRRRAAARRPPRGRRGRRSPAWVPRFVPTYRVLRRRRGRGPAGGGSRRPSGAGSVAAAPVARVPGTGTDGLSES